MADSQAQRKWEECTLLSGHGSRMVHYKLSDTAGNSIIAVVATERTLTKMYYYISEEYLRVFGCTETFNAGTRSRTRKRAAEWLDSLKAINGPIFANESQQRNHATLSAEPLMSTVVQPATHNGTMIATEDPGSSAPRMRDIMWVGEHWTCSKPGRCSSSKPRPGRCSSSKPGRCSSGKPRPRRCSRRKSCRCLCTESSDQLKHYPAFTTVRGTNIAVFSFVFAMKENKECVAYVEDIYGSQGNKMVKIRWFEFPKDVVEPADPEIFMTCQRQEIDAKDVTGVATILTPNHFYKCSNSLRSANSSPVFLCHREINKGNHRPFYVSQLHGYSTQTIIASLIREMQTLPEGELTAVPEPWSGSTVNDNRAGTSSSAPVTRKRSRSTARPQGPEDSFLGTWLAPVKRKRTPTRRPKDLLPSPNFIVTEVVIQPAEAEPEGVIPQLPEEAEPEAVIPQLPEEAEPEALIPQVPEKVVPEGESTTVPEPWSRSKRSKVNDHGAGTSTSARVSRKRSHSTARHPVHEYSFPVMCPAVRRPRTIRCRTDVIQPEEAEPEAVIPQLPEEAEPEAVIPQLPAEAEPEALIPQVPEEVVPEAVVELKWKRGLYMRFLNEQQEE